MTSTTDSTIPPSESKEVKKEITTSRIPAQKLSALQRFTSAITPKKAPKPEFPPPTWIAEGKETGGAPGSETVPPETLLEQQPSVATEEEIADAPEPQTLARRIQSLLDAKPNPTSPDQTNETVDSPENVGLDQKLKAWLSSEKVMNGSIAKGSQSVWSYLDRLRPTRSDAEGNDEKEDQGAGSDHTLNDADSGIMMYAPLLPDSSSEVEIAEQEVVEESEKPQQKGDDSSPDSKKSKHREHKVWVPSATKISLETTWWGYRLYLPPPVLTTLNTYQPVAVEKAAAISAALKWMLGKVPVALVPLPLRPSLVLLKRLAPYLGSIGVFIAWSWGRISAHDKGEGVVLTATWLLPVALVPSTWDTTKRPMQPTVGAEDDSRAEADRKEPNRARRNSLDSTDNLKPRDSYMGFFRSKSTGKSG